MEIRPILSTLRRHKTAAALLALEVALTCAIVCNALFLIGQRIEAVGKPSGIDEDRVLEVRVNGIGSDANTYAITNEDLAALRAIPGVERASAINQLPFRRRGSWNTSLSLTREQEVPTLNAAQYMGTEDLVETLGLRIAKGRDFTADEYVDFARIGNEIDPTKATFPVLVTRAVADKLYPDGSTLGRTVYMGSTGLRVVGIVESLARPNTFQGPLTQQYSIILPVRLSYGEGFYAVRAKDPSRRKEILGAVVAALDKVAPNRLHDGQVTYEETRREYFQDDRAMAWLLVVVCVALLVVTALGIVGLASFWVQQRTKQIGVRRALGATRGQILRYFQVENFLIAGIGIVLGMLLAYGLNQLLMGTYELPRLPLWYLPVGAVVLWLLGQAAVYGPARRAASVPPAVATRSV
jgi:putative ABC transport system permease protein